MNIIIVGAGDFGYQIAKKFSENKHDVTVIDASPERIKTLSESLDASTVMGKGTDFFALEKAGIEEADLFIATTNYDEINLACCYFAHKLSKCKKAARIRALAIKHFKNTTYKEFGIDLAFCPERLAVMDLMNIIESPGACEVAKVFGNEIYIKGYVVGEDSFCAGKKISELTSQFDYLRSALFVSLFRKDTLIFPHADTLLKPEDKVHILAAEHSFEEITGLFAENPRRIKNIFIAGVNNATDELLKRLLKGKYKIKIFEPDSELSLSLATRYKKITVISGKLGDEDLLLAEGIKNCDCFVACSRDEEVNIISCLIAKRYDVPRIAIYSDNTDFFPFIVSTGIDVIISPQLSSVSSLLRFAGQGTISKTLPIVFGKAEIVRVVVRKNTKLCNTELMLLKLPENSILALIIRGNDSLIPKGTTVIKENDILFFLADPENIPQIEKLNK